MGSDPKLSIRHGVKAAMKELEKSYEGPLRGLDIAKEFFAQLQGPELAGTPLGKGLGLQNALLDEALLGLSGQSNFRLPADIGRAAGNQIGGFLGAAGIEGSPAGAVAAANRLTGISEQVRGSRIGQALSVLGGTAAGSIFPSASEFLGVGASKAAHAADIQYQGGLAEANAVASRNAGIGQLIGLGAGALTGGIAGAFAPALFGATSLLGGLGAGASVGSGLLPAGLFSQGGYGGGSLEQILSILRGYSGRQPFLQ